MPKLRIRQGYDIIKRGKLRPIVYTGVDELVDPWGDDDGPTKTVVYCRTIVIIDNVPVVVEKQVGDRFWVPLWNEDALSSQWR